MVNTWFVINIILFIINIILFIINIILFFCLLHCMITGFECSVTVSSPSNAIYFYQGITHSYLWYYFSCFISFVWIATIGPQDSSLPPISTYYSHHHRNYFIVNLCLLLAAIFCLTVLSCNNLMFFCLWRVWSRENFNILQQFFQFDFVVRPDA